MVCVKVWFALNYSNAILIVHFDFSSCILHFLRSIQLETSKRVDFLKKAPSGSELFEWTI